MYRCFTPGDWHFKFFSPLQPVSVQRSLEQRPALTKIPHYLVISLLPDAPWGCSSCCSATRSKQRLGGDSAGVSVTLSEQLHPG